EVPVTGAGGAGEGAGQLPPLSAAVARAPSDAARPMAQCHPRAAPADDRASPCGAIDPLGRGGSPAAHASAAAAPLSCYFAVLPDTGRTGTGTLQTSTRPAGTLNQSSRRLRRASR